MSTSAIQVSTRPSWKEEVNRRLAEHHDRRGNSPTQLQSRSAAHSSVSHRAHEAAARVAARYANAPSYSEVLAAEARAAVRAAEAASHAAQEAHAAMQSVLAGLEAAAGIDAAAQFAESASSPRLLQTPDEAQGALDSEPFVFPEALASAAATSLPKPVSVRWDRELPARSIEPAAMRESRSSLFEEQWWTTSNDDVAVAPAVEEVEPAQPIEGNVIEFPRELVALRKARPRLAEHPCAEAEAGTQLSIFEVDPATMAAELSLEAQSGAAFADAWAAPRWSGIELDAQPADEFEQLLPEAAPAQQVLELQPASAGWRLLAIGMDAALILSAVLGAGIVALHNAPVMPSLHAAELAGAAAMALLGGLYLVLSFTLGSATPGMRYAHLQLCTLEGDRATRSQRGARLFAMLASVVPAGLGLAWAIFDENHLSWHDRWSGTYLRRL